MFAAPGQDSAGPIATALEFPDMCVSFALQGRPLRCSLTAVIFVGGPCWNESASSSGDRASDRQSGEGKGDKYEPERRVLFPSD